MAKSRIKPAVMRQLKQLARTLPIFYTELDGEKVQVRYERGGWVRRLTNHHKKLIDAYRENGRVGVENYVDQIKKEHEQYKKDILQQEPNAIKWRFKEK